MSGIAIVDPQAAAGLEPHADGGRPSDGATAVAGAFQTARSIAPALFCQVGLTENP